jgi:REP element-mobilizing transposase RayT
MMGNTCGYMVTWATYGTRLQGDEDGSTKRGRKLRACKNLEAANRRMQAQETVRLNGRQKEIVKKAICDCALRAGERVLDISVQSNHVHVVLARGGGEVSSVVSRLKNAGYFALRENGLARRVWARGYDKRYCFDGEAMSARVGYVERHGE